jgi:hypothetical protein
MSEGDIFTTSEKRLRDLVVIFSRLRSSELQFGVRCCTAGLESGLCDWRGPAPSEAARRCLPSIRYGGGAATSREGRRSIKGH